MPTTTTVKRHDTGFIFEDTLTRNGAPVNLTGSTVRFIVKRRLTFHIHTATIVNAPAGKVEYNGIFHLVDEVGELRQEWEVTFPGGQKLTFPNDDYNIIRVIEDLDNF